MIRLSKPSKMPCKSWSLEALDTCPASTDSNGDLVPACVGCYATDGNYRFPNVKAPRVSNKQDWKRDEWVSEMVEELDTERYFRWFDSGDLYSLALAEKVLQVMQATPWCKHWLPTRMHKFDKFGPVLAAMESLDNVAVRLSSDGVNGEVVENARNSSTIIQTVSHSHPALSVCPAGDQDGKCKKCRQCWNKDIKVVAYIAHGRKMAKQYKNLIAIGG